MTAVEPLVSVRDLEKYFWERSSLVDRLLRADPVAVRAVDGVSFDVQRGETLGLVGESGCGKSTTGETVLRLLTPTGGTVEYEGSDVFALTGEELRAFRRDVAIVFQDPFSSLDPRMTVGDIVREPLDVHGEGTATERADRVADLLERVGLSGDHVDRYPHEFSGGQRQRIGIARALSLDPSFLVLDEPTSALDVSVQAQVLNLLEDLQSELDLTYLLISHDLAVIRHICDRVAVMYLGEIIETGDVETLYTDPQHPYTRALLRSVPRASTDERDRAVEPISGDVPSPRDPPSGCRFRTRCPAVIPPDGVALEQSAYRAVMTLRERIDSRDISLESAGPEGLDVTDDSIPRGERFDALASHVLPPDLGPREDPAVQDALEALIEGEWETAAATLTERHESICERVNPALEDRGVHPVACHLYDY